MFISCEPKVVCDVIASGFPTLETFLNLRYQNEEYLGISRNNGLVQQCPSWNIFFEYHICKYIIGLLSRQLEHLLSYSELGVKGNLRRM